MADKESSQSMGRDLRARAEKIERSGGAAFKIENDAEHFHPVQNRYWCAHV